MEATRRRRPGDGRLGHGPRAEEEVASGAPGEPVAVRARGR